MSHVFISYKREDRDRVRRLVDALAEEGLPVWWDLEIEGGANWRAELTAKLESAACVLVVWSKESVGPGGLFVQDEASRALERKTYLPVAIDPVTPPLGFGQQHLLPLSDWRGDRTDPHFVDLVRSARSFLEGGAPLAASPTPPRHSRLTKPHLWIAAAGLLLVILGVATAPTLCRVVGPACPVADAATRAPANSIAVLPFTNLSGDAGQAYFSDGLSEELLDRLARVPQLQVAARTSSFKFREDRQSSRAIGAKLGVAYILDGSVRRQGDMIRVSAHLVEAKTGFERWSQTYDRQLKDVFAVQSGIAESVADALKVRLVKDSAGATASGGTASPAAYDAYLHGMRLFNEVRDDTGLRQAVARFDEAIAADPTYAAAYAARARALLTIANQFASADELRATYDKAMGSARQAVELAPRLPEALASLAESLDYGSREFQAARQTYQRALANGGSGKADVLKEYGYFETLMGNAQGGVAALKRAAVLDPLNPPVFRTLGAALLFARRYPEAEAALRQALALDPSLNGAHADLGRVLLLQGRPAEAKIEFALEPEEWQRLSGQALVLRKLGNVEGATSALRRLIATDGDASAYEVAQIRAQWGDLDAAFAAIDTALRVGDSGVTMLKVDPFMVPLRRDPRFADRLARAGLAG